MSLHVVFRADASLRMGSGHVMRCLTLARALVRHDIAVSFICREHPGHLAALLARQDVQVRLLPAPAGNAADSWLGATWQQDAAETREAIRGVPRPVDWLVVDHYSLDQHWQGKLRPLTRRIMAIDDLANRSHDCDLLLDQNFYSDMFTRYDAHVPVACARALGPAFALLRPEFYAARAVMRKRDGRVKRVLVTFGGVDVADDTSKAIAALLQAGPELQLDVIVPHASPHKARLFASFGSEARVKLRENVEHMAQLMNDADLAVGAGGATTWERCYLGLPSITLVVAENQARANADLATTGIIHNLGWHQQVSADLLTREIRALIARPEELIAMSDKALALMTHVQGDEPAVVEMLRKLS